MWIRRIAAAATAVIAVPALAGVAPTFASRHGASSVTARVSDPTPALGEEFVIRGKYMMDGRPAVGHAVKVQTYRDGDWLNLDGAKVTTSSGGRYRVRVVLLIRGVRDLRVVAISAADKTYHRFVVEAH